MHQGQARTVWAAGHHTTVVATRAFGVAMRSPMSDRSSTGPAWPLSARGVGKRGLRDRSGSRVFRSPLSTRLIAVWILFVALIGSPVPTPAGDDPSAPLGNNLVAITDYSDEFPFVNLMKGARDWIPGRLHECFDCRQGGSDNCASPATCPVELARDADGYVSSLNTAVNQVARSVIHAGGGFGRLPTGRYTMLYDGQGQVYFDGARIVSEQPGRIEFDIADSATNIILNLTATTPGNHLRNIRLLPPGGVCAADEQRSCDASTACGAGDVCRLFTEAGVADQQIFHPRFLANTAPYRLIRFMDWMQTNGSEVREFAEWPTRESAFWRRVPPEIMAELGNRLGSDIWINVPHLASDDFVDRLATRLQNSFRADRKIYVEYSNENWNGIFDRNMEIPRRFCSDYPDLAANCRLDGVPDNDVACEFTPNSYSVPDPARGACFQALVRAWGDRSVAIFDRFDAVFGASARDRLTRVVAAQAANADLGRQVLARPIQGTSEPVASKVDAYAIAPYLGTEYCSSSSGFTPVSHPAVFATARSLLDHLETQALPRAIGFMTNNRTMLDERLPGSGIRLIAYEGGQHLAGVGAFLNDATCNARFDEVNNDPAMGSIYRRYLEAWTESGDEFVHFVNVGRWSRYGRWGLLTHQDQAPISSVKYQAVLDFSADHPCWWPGCRQDGPPPPTIRIADVSRSEGNAGTQSFPFVVTLSPSSATPATVRYAISDGTARVADRDYIAASGTLTFNPGETTKTLIVGVRGDVKPEPNETFQVNLNNPAGALLADGQAQGTILNDDVPAIRINDVRRAEGTGAPQAFSFTVRLSAPAMQPVTLGYATANGTAKLANRDYRSARGTLTFNPGETTKTLTIIVEGDARREPNETFFVDLSNASGATFANRRGIGTILNDD